VLVTGSSTARELGRTGVKVPPLGVGVMVWGDMTRAPRMNPARNAYGPTSGLGDQREAYQVSLAAGVNLFDTAAMYGNGVSVPGRRFEARPRRSRCAGSCRSSTAIRRSGRSRADPGAVGSIE